MNVDNLLVRVLTPILGIAMSACGWWINRIDERMYSFQTEYVTRTQLEASLDRLEKSIETTFQGLESTRRAESSAMEGWLNRIESQQRELSSDIKQLLRDSKD